jgi:hypothetical protein
MTTKEAASIIQLPLSPSLSTVGSVRTEYYGEESDMRDEAHHVDVDRADGMAELQRCESSMTVLTEKAAEMNNTWFPISRSTSHTSSMWHSASTNSKISSIPTVSLSASTTTSSFGNPSFSFWPIAISLSYSNYTNNDEGLLSASNGDGDSVATVDDEDHVEQEQEGCIKSVKDVAIEVEGFKDDIAFVAREIRDFCNSPRKSVTFTHFCRPPVASDKAEWEKAEEARE